MTTRVLPPYPNPTTPAEMAFNNVHKSLRVKVENCFGLLKGQWRRLKNLNVNTVDRARLIVEVCILIHNYGIRGVGAAMQQGADDNANASEVTPHQQA